MYAIKLSPSFLLVFIIISVSVSPAFALGAGNRNLIMIGIMGVSPLLILKYRKFYWSEVWLLLFMASIVLLPLLNQPANMRWSTVMYSIMFGVTFIAYNRLLFRHKLSIESYHKLLMYLIYAYFIVLLIQQICVLTGLPIFNESNYISADKWKLNSLSAEPSHSARIMAFLMYCFITIKEVVLKRKYNFQLDIKSDKWVWLSFLWTMLTMGSGTAFVFIPIVLLKFIRFKTLLPLMVIVSISLLIINMLGISVFERTFSIFIATLTFDIDTMIKADHSASLRIVPMIILAQMTDLTTLNGWFGHGIDFVSGFLSQVIPGVPEGFTSGGMFLLLIEYGFIPFILFLIFSLSASFKKGDYLSIVFWFMLVFMYGVNSQIVWLCIILLFTNKYFIKKMNSYK